MNKVALDVHSLRKCQTTDLSVGLKRFTFMLMMMAMMFCGFGNSDNVDNSMGNMMQTFFMSKAMKEFM